MATSLLIEEERGTYTGVLHGHNGYYAGTFTTTPAETETTPPAAPLAQVHQLTLRPDQIMWAAA
jgi:hypothetical protein